MIFSSLSVCQNTDTYDNSKTAKVNSGAKIFLFTKRRNDRKHFKLSGIRTDFQLITVEFLYVEILNGCS